MKRVLTAAVLFGFLAGLGLAIATPARAESVTYARVSPAKGTTDQAVELMLPDGAFCPDEANRVIVRLTGPGLERPLNVTGNTDIRALDNKSYPGTAILPLLWTLRDAGGSVQPEPVRLDGDYRLTMSCLSGLSQQTLGDTIAELTIDGDKGEFAVTSPNPPMPEKATSTSDEQGQASRRGAASEQAAVESTEPERSQREQGAASEPVEAQQQVPMGQSGVQAAGPSDETADQPVDAAGSELVPSTGAQGAVAAEASQQGMQTKPLLIGGGLFLLAIGVLLALKSRRSSAS